MKRLTLLAVLMGLAGCASVPGGTGTTVGRFVLADAQAASSLAKDSGDVMAQRCYDFIATDISNTAAFTPGLLYLNELKRTAVAKGAGLAAACGGVLPMVIAP